MSALLARELDHDLLASLARSLPGDWPGPGPIDLTIHDLPHESASLEWWYLNCHIVTDTGRELSLFAAFFRQSLASEGPDGKLRYAHSVSFALCDPAARRYSAKVAVDGAAPALGLQKLDAGLGTRGGCLNRALREVLERGTVPGPTRLFTTDALVAMDSLDLEFGGDRFWKSAAGDYELELRDEQNQISCRLSFSPEKLPHRFGKDGIVHGVSDELMFYYYIPRCSVSGQLTVGGVTETVLTATGWYDHEFGFKPKTRPILRPISEPVDEQTSWRWLSMQLEGGVDVSTFIITRGDRVLDNWTVVSDADGRYEAFTGALLTPLRTWRSTRSFVEYPVSFQLELPEARIRLRIEAAFDDQEVLSVISDPGFWEGRVQVFGSVAGRPVTGKGWVECKGFRFANIESFFGAVGKEVRQRIAALLPSRPSVAELSNWLVRDARAMESGGYAVGVQPRVLTQNLIAPLREIADRGGKSWRSYAALACIDVVGGDSRKFLHWLPIPELLHVGSLIIDDVEDDSTVRRGGPTCHLQHGRPRAINAGTAAYFLSEPPLDKDALPAADKLRIYGLYFDALRAGHAGQALDLAGTDEQARRAARHGDTEQLERQVLAIHRLKTAVPAAMLARIGAILGGGSPAQVEGLGEFFEALGMAFQIVDDVLNLRGFEHGLKERGEDITQGKITLPVVKGLARLPHTDRNWLLETIFAKTDQPERIAAVIAALEATGAIDDCLVQAQNFVDRAWARVDPLLADSQYKIVFRAFSAYVLERHY
jgi:geranylgeranyl pyrophosphate synthase/predicted secreted hydrolase